MDDLAIVLYGTGNVKGGSFTTVRFRNAALFVTGAIAVLWSKLCDASAIQLSSAVTQLQHSGVPRLSQLLLNAWAIHNVMGAIYGRK